MLAAVTVLWLKKQQMKMRYQLVAGFIWEAGGIPQWVTAFSECCLLHGMSTMSYSPHSWAAWAKTAWGCFFASESLLKKAKPCSGLTSLSHFVRSGTSATPMLPQQRLSKYRCRKYLTTLGHTPISNTGKTRGADFRNISLFRRHRQRKAVVKEFNGPWTRIL